MILINKNFKGNLNSACRLSFGYDAKILANNYNFVYDLTNNKVREPTKIEKEIAILNKSGVLRKELVDGYTKRLSEKNM